MAPHAVTQDDNTGDRYLYVDYAALVPYAIAMAKQALAETAALRAAATAAGVVVNPVPTDPEDPEDPEDPDPNPNQ